MNTFNRVLGLILLLLATVTASAEQTIKMATLAPPGSTWMNIVDEWAEEVEQRTNGEVRIKMYPNGVAGDEPDVLRKIRYGQINGGIFTGYGIGRFYSPARVLEIPFLFESIEEIDYVRNALMPEIERGYQENGYELLGWMEVGFVRFFSSKAVHSLDELRERRIWLWQGDPLGQAFFNSTGISPVPLSIIDVYTSLSTGLIDTVYSTPLASIALQWFSKTKYISKIHMLNAIGSMVVDKRVFDKLTPEQQSILKESGERAGKKLIEATRRDNKTSLDVLLGKGHQLVMGWDDLDPNELESIRKSALKSLTDSNYIPKDLLDRTMKLIQEYRDQHTQSAPASNPQS